MTNADEIKKVREEIEGLRKMQGFHSTSGPELGTLCAAVLFSDRLRSILTRAMVYERGTGEDVRKKAEEITQKWTEAAKTLGFDQHGKHIAEASAARGDALMFLLDHAPSIIASANLAARVKTLEEAMRRFGKCTLHDESCPLKGCRWCDAKLLLSQSAADGAKGGR